MEEQVFQSRYLAADTFLNKLTETFGLGETVDVKYQLVEWMAGEAVPWILDLDDLPEIKSAIAGTDEQWTGFAAFAQRVLGMTASEAEVE
jgi:hypothetical protein